MCSVHAMTLLVLKEDEGIRQHNLWEQLGCPLSSSSTMPSTLASSASFLAIRCSALSFPHPMLSLAMLDTPTQGLTTLDGECLEYTSNGTFIVMASAARAAR